MGPFTRVVTFPLASCLTMNLWRGSTKRSLYCIFCSTFSTMFRIRNAQCVGPLSAMRASALPENAGCDALVQLGFRVLAKDKIYACASNSRGLFPLTNALRPTATALPIFSRQILPFPQYHSFHNNFPITVVLPRVHVLLVLPVCVNPLLGRAHTATKTSVHAAMRPSCMATA